ncbi:MAG: flagellin [Thermoguttaceae bacterium]|jgi:flagellin-like hook-associated protein FlgL
MARIGSALTGIERRLLNSLALANAQVTLSSFRMATGHKINAPSDDPSAFVMLSGLQSQLSSVTATLSNATAAGSMISQTQTALGGIQTQLNAIRTELLKDVNHTLTDDQRAQSQAIIDAAIDQINTLAGTSINGKTLLDGAADYTYSGRNNAQVADVVVRGAAASGTTISGTVSATATQAMLTYTGDSSSQIVVSQDTTFTLTGTRGSQVITVHNGEALSDLATAVNDNSYNTGVTAEVHPDHTLTITSVDYGSSAKVSVAVTAGDQTFSFSGGDGYGNSTGTNASAVINGISIASDSGNVSGNRFTVNSNGSTFEIEFKPGFTGGFDPITVTGNNLSFAMSQSVGDKSSLTIPAVASANFSGPSGALDDLYSGGSLAGLGDNTSQAIRVVDESLGKLSRVQGAVDGFYNAAVSSSSGLLSDMQTKLGDYIDSINKVDDVEETQNQDYYQALADNALSGLTIVNQQRQSIVNILQDIAGLKQT